MRFITSLLVLSLVCLASAYKHPERSECTMESAAACVTEIGGKFQRLIIAKLSPSSSSNLAKLSLFSR